MDGNVYYFVYLVAYFISFNEAAGVDDDFCKTMPLITNTSECCQMPDLFGDEIWKSCMEDGEENITQAEAVFSIIKGKCIGDCVFQTAGYLKAFDIIYDMLNESIINTTAENPVWAPIIPDLIENATITIDRKHKADDPWQCDTKADMFMEYLYSLLLINCPNQIWMENDECADMNKRFEMCPHNLQSPRENMFRKGYSRRR